METSYLKDTTAKMALLASADSAEEALAVLKQILATLGYESEVACGSDRPPKLAGASLAISPAAAPHWSIRARLANRVRGESGPESEYLARMACEMFGAVVAAAESRSKLAALDERLRDAISTLHHDIRTPLTSIAGMAQTLLMRPSVSDEVQREFLERIENSAEAITAMTDEFRAGLDAMLTVASLPVEIARLDDVFQASIDKAVSKGANISIVARPERPLFVGTPPAVVAEVLEGVVEHFASVLAGKAVAALRAETPHGLEGTGNAASGRVILKGPTRQEYAVPGDLAKIWVPEGTLLSNEQVERLARPFHLCKAVGGSLDISEEGGEVVFEVRFPLTG